MASRTMTREPSADTKAAPKRSSSPRPDLDPAIQTIIDRARSEPVWAPARAAWMLPGLSAILLWACFTPLNWSPLGWVALVPLCLLVRLQHRPRRLYLASWLCGFAWCLATFQWMRLGHPTMYVALVALSAYIAFYFPVFVALSRVAVHRFRIPMLLAVPVIWTGLEYARAYLLTGCAWYYLGHSQYRWIGLIQISDIVGAYGVSFVLAMANAGIAMLLPTALFERLRIVRRSSEPGAGVLPTRRPMVIALTTVGVFAAVLVYGHIRLDQAEFETGPRVALVQGNFTSAVKHDPDRWVEMVRTHDMLTRAAVAHRDGKARPELIVWPETMFPWPIYEVDPEIDDDRLRQLKPESFRITHEEWVQMFRSEEAAARLHDDARAVNAGLLIGIESWRATQDGAKQYNSTAFITPEMGYVGRYNKMHRVIFGEYIPLKDWFPWLRRFTPYGANFGIEAGEQAAVFQWGGNHFAPIICFEDTVPQLVRGITRSAQDSGQRLDFFVNNTNDGWFHGSSELDQHLITAAFRCVECRTPMVRAVNTGVSAFIDGDGVIREPDVFIDGEQKGRRFLDESGDWSKQLHCVLVDNVALDNRESLYVRGGDWFAGSCGFGCAFLAIGGLFRRRRPAPAPAPAAAA